MSAEDERAILGLLGRELSDRLVGLLGDPSDAERAHQLSELADLLAEFGEAFRGRAAELSIQVVDGQVIAQTGERRLDP